MWFHPGDAGSQGGYSGLDPTEDTESWGASVNNATESCYSGLDPTEDTERLELLARTYDAYTVTVGSIRQRILKDQPRASRCGRLRRYSGLDPTEDTERDSPGRSLSEAAVLQWARSDRGY